MKERPILFSAPMVRALLEGRKSQTRRMMGLDGINKDPDAARLLSCINGVATFGHSIPDDPVAIQKRCPHGQRGDRLWVRETWRVGAWRDDGRMALDYAASPELVRTPWLRPPGAACVRLVSQSSDDCHKAGADQRRDGSWEWEHGKSPCRWRPSIFMPRWASRITLELTEVRVQRLQDISEEDAKAEGVEQIEVDGAGVWRDYELGAGTWCNSARGSFSTLWDAINGPGSWKANPWVWAISFRVLEKKGGA